MLVLGKVVKNIKEEDKTYKGRVLVRISPIHDALKDEDLPALRPLFQRENEFANLIKDDLIYVYTEDDCLNELYYLGEVNMNVNLQTIVEDVDRTNSTLKTMKLKEVKKDISAYALDKSQIKISAYGSQLIFMNGQENFTLIANKKSGAIFYIDETQASLAVGDNSILLNSSGVKISNAKSQNYIEMSSSGEIKIVSSSNSGVSISGGNIVLASGEIRLGGSVGYVVTCPTPAMTTTSNGMVLKASETVKAG